MLELPGGVRGDPGARALFCKAHNADRIQPLLETRPTAGGKVDKDDPDPGHAAPWRSSAYELIPALLARLQAGRSELHVRHLVRSACRQRTQAIAGITDMVRAPFRFLKEVFDATTQRPSSRSTTRREDQGTAFGIGPSPARLDDILCIHEERTRLKRQHGALQAPGTSDRPPAATVRHYVKARVRRSTNTPTAQWPSSMDRDVTRYHVRWPTDRQPNPRGPSVTRLVRRDRAGALWTSGHAAPLTDHYPHSEPETATEAVNSAMVHKPVNSVCSRHRCLVLRRHDRLHVPTGLGVSRPAVA